MNTTRWTRGLVMSALIVAAATPAAHAQEREKNVTVEIRNGKVFVNGVERTVDPDDPIVLEDDKGDDVTVFVRRGRGGRALAWVDRAPGRQGFVFRGVHPDSAEFRVFTEPMRQRMERLRSEFGEQERAMTRLRGDLAIDTERLRSEVERGVRGGAFWMGDGPIARLAPDPEVRELEREIRELALQLRRADASERAGLEAELDAKLREAFDRKQEADRREAEALSSRLEQMRNRLSQRDSARDEVIARRKRDLLGERDALDW